MKAKCVVSKRTGMIWKPLGVVVVYPRVPMGGLKRGKFRSKQFKFKPVTWLPCVMEFKRVCQGILSYYHNTFYIRINKTEFDCETSVTEESNKLSSNRLNVPQMSHPWQNQTQSSVPDSDWASQSPHHHRRLLPPPPPLHPNTEPIVMPRSHAIIFALRPISTWEQCELFKTRLFRTHHYNNDDLN